MAFEAKPLLHVLDQAASILVVDDDPIFCEFASVYLSTPSASVELAADGVEAWARLVAAPFDLALLDIDMPGLDGFELLERIRAEPSLEFLPVVMVTGREDMASIDKAFALGATSFVTKPINWRQLSYQLRYVLRMSRFENEMRGARDRAEEISTLKTNLLAVLSHEFRTPLSAIIGFASILSRAADGGQSEKYREYAGIIETSGYQLLDMLLEMLNYAQIISPRYDLNEEECPVERLVDLAFEAVQDKAAAAAVVLTRDIPCGGAMLRCDRQQIVRMLRNLLANCIVHGGGGRIAATLDDLGGLVIAIADDGPGISPERQAHCLAPFAQADMSLARTREGLGLGLPVAARIAALHGAAFQIDNSGIKGTRILVTFPASRVRMHARPVPLLSASA